MLLSPVLIRPAVATDVGAVQDLFRRSALSNDGDREVLLAHPDTLDFSPTAVTEGRTQVATDADDRIVGFVTTLMVGATIELEDLFVDPACARQGVGRELVLAALVIARGQGIRRVEVTANPHALAFYSRVGFGYVHDVQTRFGPAPRLRLDL